MPEHISECNLCGGREFAVVEVLAWRGQLDESGRLSCTLAGANWRASAAPIAARRMPQEISAR